MSIFSNVFSNVSAAVKNLGTAAANVGGTFGPIVSAFNPAAGTVLSQIGQLGTAVAGAPKANTVTAQAMYAVENPSLPVQGAPSSFGAAPSFMQKYKWPLIIGGGVAALVLGIYLMKG